MEDQKILDICKFYNDELSVYYNEIYIRDTYKHLLYMLWKIPHFIEEGRKEKANRWLGFVQGVLWAKDIYTIEEMKEHNRPNEKE